MPHPGSSQARQERLTRSILASAEASPCRVAGQFGSEPVGVEFAHPGQAQLSQQGQLWRDRK
ncbi:hypothetical protein [Klebsiella pneumoniae]|nr:hypothetical protein [Klebsiella pneumoniae]